VAEALADVPERTRPDLPVVVHLAVQVLRIVEVRVEPPQAVRHGRGIRGRVPVGDARERFLLRNAEPLRDDVADRDCPVVGEPLADRARLLRCEREVLTLVEGVAVLVQDHLGVLCIVDAALAEADLVRRMVGRERVVHAVLVDPHRLGDVVDPTPRLAEAQTVHVLLRLGDPVVRHHLLELVLISRVDERVRRRVRRAARLAEHRRVGAAQEPAAVEVRQRDGVVRRVGDGGGRVLLVGQRLVAEARDRVRHEHRRRARRAAGRRLAGGRGRHDDDDGQHDRARKRKESVSHPFSPCPEKFAGA